MGLKMSVSSGRCPMALEQPGSPGRKREVKGLDGARLLFSPLEQPGSPGRKRELVVPAALGAVMAGTTRLAGSKARVFHAGCAIMMDLCLEQPGSPGRKRERVVSSN